WPYETMIESKRPVSAIQGSTEEEKAELARTMQEITTRYDNILKTSFSYSAGMQHTPVNAGEHQEWHRHMPSYPPLLRSATGKKCMVGYEMLATPQRDITPEQAANTLKQQSTIHYKG